MNGLHRVGCCCYLAGNPSVAEREGVDREPSWKPVNCGCVCVEPHQTPSLIVDMKGGYEARKGHKPRHVLRGLESGPLRGHSEVCGDGVVLRDRRGS